MAMIYFQNLPNMLRAQIHPVRARHRGTRESELRSYESSASGFDILYLSEQQDTLDANLDQRITIARLGGTIGGPTYNTAAISLIGLDEMDRRLQAIAEVVRAIN